MKAILFSIIFTISAFAVDFDKLNPYKEADFKILEDNLESFITNCKARDGKSCRLASITYFRKYKKSGYDIELGKLTLDYALKGCELRDGGSCYIVATEYGYIARHHRIVQENYEKEMEYLLKGCDYNYIYACYSLGHRYYIESLEKTDKEKKEAEIRAKQFYKKACDLGDKFACKK